MPLLLLCAFAQEAVSKGLLKDLVKPASPCDLTELATGGALLELGRKEQVLTPEWLDIVDGAIAEGIPRPRAKQERASYPRTLDSRNERYFTVWPKNPTFQTQVRLLSTALRNDPWLKLTIGDVTTDADFILRTEKRAGRLGECYKVSQVTGTFNSEWVQTVSLGSSVQTEIDREFSKPFQKSQLTELGQKLLAEGVLTHEELAELRAVRAATEIFEKNSVLKDDLGSFRGNYDFMGRIRTVCRTEAQTFYFFLKTLSQRGLLKHFTPSETWAYRKKALAPDGHGASLLENRRTKELIVVDSWHEAGGIPAHITRFSDWVKSHDHNDLVMAR